MPLTPRDKLGTQGPPPRAIEPTLALSYYGVTAMTKMTFSAPEPLAVPPAARLEERDAALIRACDLANQNMDLAEIEKEFDGLCDEMAEPCK